MAKFDPTKPVQTRDGRPARIIATDLKNASFPIVAIIKTPTLDEEYTDMFRDNGRCYHGDCDDGSDLVNIPEETHIYFNLYQTCAVKHSSEAKAKMDFDRNDPTGVTVRFVTIDGKFARLDVL